MLCAVLLVSSSFAAVPPSNHVVIVFLENRSYSAALTNMPWLKSLATKYAYDTAYYGNVHGSIGDYFMATTGQIITTNASYPGTVTANNLARQFIQYGRSWRVYAESLPYDGYVGGSVYPYVKDHNPFAYFSDVQSSQRYNIVRLEQHWLSDVAAGTLPQFSFIVPNQLHNAHDGTKAQCDTWLKSNLASLLQSPEFQKDGILIITFDEAYSTDTTHGGGHVLTVIAGPDVKSGFKDTHSYYQHQSLLKTVEFALGLPKIGAASSTSSLGAAFK